MCEGNLEDESLIFDDLRAIQSQYGYLRAEQLQSFPVSAGTPLYRITA